MGGMGFKDFEAFNIALLAKQFWLTVANPKSFWVQILKGLYFLNKSCLEAVKGASPSWVSSSLLEGRKLLQNGLRWNVGNGESVQFWNDKWVYSLPGEKISSTPPHSGEVTLVAHSWDHDKLRSCVSEEERKTISKIAFFD